MKRNKNKVNVNFRNKNKFNWDDLLELRSSCSELVLNQFVMVGEINKAYLSIEKDKQNPETKVLLLGYIKSLEECFIRIRYNSEKHIVFSYNVSDKLSLEDALNNPSEFFKIYEDPTLKCKDIKEVKKGLVKYSKKGLTSEQYDYININSEYVNLALVLRDLTGLPTYKIFSSLGFTDEDIKKFDKISNIVQEGGEDSEIMEKVNELNKKEENGAQ